ncbi:MAG TPA: carboxylating nicotinate-nucleotide diphosphorylase [Nitrospiraceae bacterium]|nr:carboxylating nicotinate-nucleotide diphosphorylase [Nitrospiraceae bacterium]
MSPPPAPLVRDIVRQALTEDLAYGDVTTSVLFPKSRGARATIVARQEMVAAGIAVAREVFLAVDSTLTVRCPVRDGQSLGPSTTLLVAEGDGRALLMAERVALNFLQRLSGIATLTRRFCLAVRRFPTRILDTRKTTPGLRILEKWAVRLGGGSNHRFSLSDGLLIKDNHLALLRADGISLRDACRQARANGPHGIRVIVEAQTLADVTEALKGAADVILLDNMSPSLVRKAADMIKGRALIEVSGGITLANAEAMARAGADFLSIGALTHSAPAADLSMDLRATGRRIGSARK